MKTRRANPGSRLLTKDLACYHPAILSRYCRAGVALVHILHKRKALVHGATHNLAVLGEDGFDVGFLDHEGIEVSDEDAGIEGTGICLVGDVAGHSSATQQKG